MFTYLANKVILVVIDVGEMNTNPALSNRFSRATSKVFSKFGRCSPLSFWRVYFDLFKNKKKKRIIHAVNFVWPLGTFK